VFKMLKNNKIFEKYKILSFCSKNIDMFLSKFKNGDLGRRPVNLREFRQEEKRRLIQKLHRYFREINWFLDLTARSVIPLNKHKSRKGKYQEIGYIILYNFKYRYGYAIKQNSYRNIQKKQLIRLLKVSKVTEIIGTDKRHSDIPNIVAVPKRYTAKLDRLFGFKTGIYQYLKNHPNISEIELDNLYRKYFEKLGIQLIN